MRLFVFQFLFKLFFVVSIALTFIQCSSDDAARKAAKEEALKSASEPNQASTKDISTQAARPPVVGQLPLQISSATVAKGSETCLSVTTAQFNLIVSMQYTMKWDPAVLKFKEVKGFGLPGMAATNFGASAADKGLLAYSWFDANVQGITQGDGYQLYEVCFETIGESGQSSNVEFVDKPVVIEISNAASQFLGLDATSGVVRIQ